MRRRLLLTTLLLGACRFDATLPPGTVVTCHGDGDCPSGSLCQAEVCVPAGAKDDVPPDVVQGTVTLTIDALPGEPVPDALAELRTARLRFTVTEPLAALPVLTAPPELLCTLVEATELTFASSCALVPGLAPTETVVSGFSVSLVDRARNAATVPLPVSLALDTVAPPPPAVDTPGAVLFRRAPYGDTDGGPTSFVVLGAPGAAPGAATVRVLAEGHEVGVGQVDADGGFRAQLVRIATSVVQVRAVDGAGNASGDVQVRDGEWVATPGGRVPGQAVPNPHPLSAWGAMGQAVPQGQKNELGATDGVAVADGQSARVLGRASWRMRLPGTFWGFDDPGLMVLDVARGRIVLFTVYGLKEWDGLSWVPRTSSDPEGDGDPELPTHRMAGAWDPTTGLVLYLTDPSSSAPGLWGWNGASWRRLPDGPPVRLGPVFVQDGVGQQVLFFGGAELDGGVRDDLWAWRGTGWTRPDAGALPAARTGAAAAWDPLHGVAWVFSGRGVDGGALNDFWRWDGSQFVPVPSSGPGPSPRVTSQLTCESAGRCWLWGGVASDGGALSDVWSWDGQAWALASSDGGPEGGGKAALVAHPGTGRLVLFPGNPSDTGGHKSTWLWDGARWTMDPQGLGDDYAPNFGELGCAWPNGPCMGTTDATAALLDSQGWHATLGPMAPTAIGLASVAWEAAKNRFVRSTFPSATQMQSQVFDLGVRVWSTPAVDPGISTVNTTSSAGGVPGVLTAYYSGELYRFTDAGYQQLLPSGSVVSNTLCAASMPDGGVFMGGHSAVEISDGGYWTLPAPPVRLTSAAYEPASGRLLAVMGWQTPLYTTFTDGGWADVGISDYDGFGVPLKVDLGHLDGHVIGWEPPSHLWRLDWADAHPGVDWAVLWADAQLPPGATLTEVRAQATAGAISTVDGGVAAGAQVGFFVGARWLLGPPTAAPPASPGAVVLQVTDANILRELREEGPTLHVEVVPVGLNGGAAAELDLDSLELHVRYRLP